MNIYQTLVSRDTPSHWYLPDGTPFHSVPNKSRLGEMRSVTIADARAAGAVPSVTNILSVISKPALTAWLQESAIMASLTLPRSVDEPLDVFAKRVVGDMDAQSKKAAEFGSQIHEECAGIVQAWEESHLITVPSIGEYAVEFSKWVMKNVTKVHAVEKVFVGDGYAGRVDLIANLADLGTCVIDLKTQAIKNDKPAFYPEWPLQLAAYRAAYRTFPFPLISIVINSKEPGPVHVKQWPEADYYKTFLAAFKIWKFIKSW